MRNAASAVRLSVASRILTTMTGPKSVSEEDARLLRTFAETPEEEKMALDELARTIVERERKRRISGS